MNTTKILSLFALVLALPVVTPAQNLFLVNRGNNAVVKFAYTGGALNTNGAIFANASAGLDGPYGVAFDSSGNLYVASAFNSTITLFTNNAGILSTNGTVFATASSGLNYPFGLAFDGSGNLSYISDQNDGGNITAASGPAAANYAVTSLGYLTITNAGNHTPNF